MKGFPYRTKEPKTLENGECMRQLRRRINCRYENADLRK